jgi:hypothetical protein
VDTGDRLSFVVQEDGTVIVKPITHHVRELGGYLHRPGQRPVSVRELDEGIARRMRSKFDAGDDRTDTDVLVRH